MHPYRFSRRCSLPEPQSSPSCWAHSPLRGTPEWGPAESCRTRCCCSWFLAQGRQSASFSFAWKTLPSNKTLEKFIPIFHRNIPARRATWNLRAYLRLLLLTLILVLCVQSSKSPNTPPVSHPVWRFLGFRCRSSLFSVQNSIDVNFLNA